MATSLFDEDPTQQIPKPKSSQQRRTGSDLFQFLPEDVEQGAVSTVRDLFSGDIFDASRARASEALARASQQARQTAGSQMGPNLGQGSAIRSQQAVEQDILGNMADMHLGFAEMEAKGRERGVDFAAQLERIGGQKYDRNIEGLATRMSDIEGLLGMLGPNAPPEQISYFANLYGDAWRQRQNLLGAEITDEDVQRVRQSIASGDATDEDYALLGVGIDVYDWWTEGEGTIISDGLTGDAAQWAAKFSDPNASEGERVAAAEKLGEVIGAAYWARGGNSLTDRQTKLLEDAGLIQFFSENPSLAEAEGQADQWAQSAFSGSTISEAQAVAILSKIESGENVGVPVARGGIPTGIHTYNHDARGTTQGKRAWRLNDTAYTWVKQAMESKQLIEAPNGRLVQVVDYWEPGSSSNDKLKAAFITFRDVVTGQTFNYSGRHDFSHTPRNSGDLGYSTWPTTGVHASYSQFIEEE